MRPAARLAVLLTVLLASAIARTGATASRDAYSTNNTFDPHIFDGAGFFSEEAASEADDIIRAIKQAHDRDVVVETYAAVPDDLKDELTRDGKDKFYENWLNRRAKHLGVRGVFVLMTREPGRVQVGVDRSTRQRAFTVADSEGLREILASAFRARQFDRGLLEGLRFVRRRMSENSAPGHGPAVPVAAGTRDTRQFSR